MLETLTREEYVGLCREIILKDSYCLRSLIGSRVRTILDVGANVGLFSFCARLFFPEARILAIEPDRKNYECLMEFVKPLNIEVYNYALGDGSRVRMGEGLSTQKGVIGGGDISSFSLSGLFGKFVIDPNENVLIKIDCEGSEGVILDNLAEEDILNRSMQWMLEVHCKSEQWPNAYDWERWNKWLDKMKGSGYVSRRLLCKYGLGLIVKRNYF